MHEDHVPAGFRFSWTDAVVLLLGLPTTVTLWIWVETFALMVPFLLIHFLLFCNIFRVCRFFELIWSAFFVVNFCLWLAAEVWGVWIGFSWLGVLALQTPITVLLIWLQVRAPEYHGIRIIRER